MWICPSRPKMKRWRTELRLSFISFLPFSFPIAESVSGVWDGGRDDVDYSARYSLRNKMFFDVN